MPAGSQRTCYLEQGDQETPFSKSTTRPLPLGIYSTVQYGTAFTYLPKSVMIYLFQQRGKSHSLNLFLQHMPHVR